MTETTKPLPGTHEALARGCTCVREGWEWNAAECSVHAPRPKPAVDISEMTDDEMRAAGYCPRHGIKFTYGYCSECDSDEAAWSETMRSLRPSIPAGRTVSSWRQGEWW